MAYLEGALALESSFVLRLPMFEGPLDLLLYLIEKNRFTLQDLEVCPIIDQYLAYIEQIRSLDIALAGEFLDMASYLIWLKSRILLPVDVSLADGEERNPVEELKEMLMAYRAIKQASHELSERPMLFRDKFPKGAALEERGVSSTTMGALLQAIDTIRARTKQVVMNIPPMRFSIHEIMARIQGLFAGRSRIALQDAALSGDRMEIIGTLMAALEMSRLSMARIVQRGLFSAIYLIKRTGSE
ncbi:MAG: segregation/condensation protein A [Deltaproteobacteria bacterium]|nr:segregation/condensation protein A [Deltaproteobacteria bacterium]